MLEQPLSRGHTFSQWVVATRPWSFPASAMPVIVTLSFLFWKGCHIQWLYGLLAAVNIVVFQAAGNTWSDYFDYRQGVDAADTYGVRTLTEKIFAPREIFLFSLCLLSAAVCLGLLLVACTTLKLLYIGLFGTLLTLLYPYLKYHALGDVVIGFAYALLPVLGTSLVATGRMDPGVLLVALPLGAITVAILHVNNIRDIATDRRASISTLAMLLGKRRSLFLYLAYILFPVLYIPLMVIMRFFPLSTLLALLALPLVIANAKAAYSSLETGNNAAIAKLDERTALLQLLFGTLLTLSFFLGSI